MAINVQFSDESNTTIISYFSCAQDPDSWLNQAVIDEHDERYRVYFNGLDVLTRMGMPDPL